MTPRDVRLFLVAIDTARQRPKMASLLREEVFETRGQAPAPSKDVCQLLVTRREVVAGLPARGRGAVSAPPFSSPHLAVAAPSSAQEGRQAGRQAAGACPRLLRQ